MNLRLRVAIGAVGVAGMAYGALRLLTSADLSDLVFIGIWLAAGVVLHDAVLAPLIELVGRLVSRVSASGRASVQGALVVCGLIAVVGMPIAWQSLVANHDPSLALLQQNYVRNLVLLWVGVACAAAASWWWTRVRRSGDRVG